MAIPNPHKKRSYSELSPIQGEESVEDHWPRFIVIRSSEVEKPLSKFNCFAIEKLISGIIGTAKNINRTRSGDLIVEVQRKAQSDNLLKIKELLEVPVFVFPHKTLNSVKGVIRSFQLLDIDSEELVEHLRSEGVVEARRIFQNRDGVKRPTTTIILTFAGTILPNNIKAGYMRLPVSPFIPNPLRCYNCQKTGHHVSNCKRDKVCAKCSLPDHGEEPCSQPNKCVNCGGSHPSYYTTCPVWQFEKEVCKTKTLEKVPYAAARKLVLQYQQPKGNATTYASATRGKPATRSVETQTDIINCNCVVIESNANSGTQTETTTSKQPQSPSSNRTTKNDRRTHAQPSERNLSRSPGKRRSGSAVASGSRQQRLDLTNLSKEAQSAARLANNRFNILEGMDTDDPLVPSQGTGKVKTLINKITAPS